MEGPVLEGLCADDFARKHTLVRAPETIDVVRCAHCGALKTNGSWVEADLEDVLLDLIAANAERDPRVERVRYTCDLRTQDDRIHAVTVKATCRVGDWDLLTSFHTTLRVHGGVCPTCTRRKGGYFVGTVQVRAEGREVTKEERRRVRELASRADARGASEEFVSRIEEVRGGLDVLTSTNPLAKRLAKELAKEFQGTVGSSATLHTKREGRDAYRATYVVRLPGFQEGDVLVWRRVKYRVLALGPNVRLEEVETGKRLNVRAASLRGARVVRR